MKIPIVSVKTSDKLELYGILLEAPKKDAVIINIHGTADNFYDNEFIWEIARSVAPLNISMLSVNNRGSYGLEFYDYGPDVYRNSGASTEIFEKCLNDIDAWIKYALKLGYKKIILQGHSLGTEKISYYMGNGKYRNKVAVAILLGFSDSYGTHFAHWKKMAPKLLDEAKTLIKQGKKDQFLTRRWLAHAGVLPQSAESFFNFFGPQSELAKALPLRQGKNLINFQKIKVPILGVISDGEEFTIIPVKEAIELLQNENKRAEIYQIKNCDHNFTGKEKELGKLVKGFLGKRLSRSPR
jgi:pimeloyl-ACP methyl ester carboxylesterase